MGGDLERTDGDRPKTFARYLKLCTRMAGLKGEVEFEDAIGIASFLVTMERVPPAGQWVDSLITRARDEINRGFGEALF